MLLSSMLEVSSKGIGCSGVTYPDLMKQDFFGLRILRKNGLRLPFYSLFVINIRFFRLFAFFPAGNEGTC